MMPRPVQAGSLPLEVAFLSDLDEIERLAPAWEALNLEAQDHESPGFVSSAWCLHIARIRASDAASRTTPLIAVVREGGRVIGIWPLAIITSNGWRIARCIDDPFGQFAGVAFESREKIGPGIAAILEAMASRRCADALLIDHVVEGTPLSDALDAAGARIAEVSQSVVVDLRPYATFRDYMSAVGLKTRKAHRNNLNRLSRQGTPRHIVTEERAEVADIIRYTFDRRLDWLDDRGTTAPAFRSPLFRRIVEELPDVAGLSLIGFDLRLGDDVVARQWGFVYRNRYYAYLSARNEAFDPAGPGSLHLGMVIEACHARGIEVLELMGPPSPYKLRWTDATKTISARVLPLSSRGRLWMSAWHFGAKPLMRSAYHALPRSWRSGVNAHLNKR